METDPHPEARHEQHGRRRGADQEQGGDGGDQPASHRHRPATVTGGLCIGAPVREHRGNQEGPARTGTPLRGGGSRPSRFAPGDCRTPGNA